MATVNDNWPLAWAISLGSRDQNCLTGLVIENSARGQRDVHGSTRPAMVAERQDLNTDTFPRRPTATLHLRNSASASTRDHFRESCRARVSVSSAAVSQCDALRARRASDTEASFLPRGFASNAGHTTKHEEIPKLQGAPVSSATHEFPLAIRSCRHAVVWIWIFSLTRTEWGLP
jgi:hypothetical protein